MSWAVVRQPRWTGELSRDNRVSTSNLGVHMKSFKLHRVLILGISWVLAAGSAIAEEKAAPLWGYGIKSCYQFVQARNGRERGEEEAIAEYRRYEDWLTGFTSGLNLATGMDVMVGVDIEGALRRIHLYCDDHRKADFFSATMDLVKLLSQLK